MLRMFFISAVLLLGRAHIVLGQEVEMSDQFRADGKIYVVVGVILILLIGLFIYLFRIERKVKELEK